MSRPNATDEVHSPLGRLKAVLSAIFKLAIQQDYRPGPNPIRETSLLREPEAEETIAHDLDTVPAMLRLVPEPSRTAIAIAAFAGLRRGEIEGLLWANFDGRALKVAGSICEGIAGELKSKKSKACVSVISALGKLLEQHRLRSGNPGAGINGCEPPSERVPSVRRRARTICMVLILFKVQRKPAGGPPRPPSM
jgi:integrase